MSSNRIAMDHPIPQVMFYLIIASIPFFRWRQLPGPDFMKLDWLLTAGLLGLIGAYLGTLKGPPTRLRANIWIPWVLFLLANLLATLLSPYPDQAWSGMVVLFQASIYFMIVLLLVSDRGFETFLPWTIGLSMGLGALLSVLGYFFNVEAFSQEGTERAYGGTISANNMALMCVYALPVAVHWAVYGKRNLIKLLGLGTSLMMVLGVVSTVSRGGFLNLLVVSGLLAYQYRIHFKVRYLGLVVAGMTIGLLVIGTMIPEEFFERQATLVTEGTQDKSLDRRSSYVIVAFDAIQAKPILGWGTSAFRKLWVESEETRWFDMIERPAHNTYLEVAVGSGILGLCLFAALLLKAYLNFRNAEKMLLQKHLYEAAHLVGAYKLGLVVVLFYFLFKSGIEHKYFLLALPLSVVALRFALAKTEALSSEAQTDARATSP
ncbi:O-antigen ligase family protein [Gilvimarinus sp. SDUM040013]|uniref:O-antigen ligase family protein n=1 Tax=Gilvimarinus gilvus TaxID=3058038 RepID=A0ABU4RX47_9GAMM|nr:O-antigen ligase family protein [Gilvimarinus sp. SDUM040013]MDO3386842.1 O-antigen ligase family protein [Gilvimarinus sp. SDUM040013]MDX6848228.1 O-antigen ligase family protein [Gilvimarinus sp. SDUM040013]